MRDHANTYRMGHEIQMRKGRAKVSSIDVSLSGGFWKIETVTSRTKDVDGVIARHITQSDRQNRLSLTKDMGAPPKRRDAILFVHGMHSPIGNNVAVTVIKIKNNIESRIRKYEPKGSVSKYARN
jgi:hypothetical protein